MFVIDLRSACKAHFESQLVETGCTILLCLRFGKSSIPFVIMSAFRALDQTRITQIL